MHDEDRGPVPRARWPRLKAIEKGCNLPLEEGLKAETEAFVPLVGSPISRNLIGVFFMTQRLQQGHRRRRPAVQAARGASRSASSAPGSWARASPGARPPRRAAVMLDSVARGAREGRRQHHEDRAWAASRSAA